MKVIDVSLYNNGIGSTTANTALRVSLAKWWDNMPHDNKKTQLGMAKNSLGNTDVNIMMFVFTPYKSLSKNMQQFLRQYYTNKLKFLGIDKYIKVE